MDRENVKKALPILQAVAEGKPIQWRDPDDYQSKWDDINAEELNEIQIINYSEDYRIKPESAYRPFANAEECWAEMQKHQPFGWVKDKKDGHHALITAVDDDTCGMSLNGNAAWSLQGIKDLFTFADGAPFGVKVGE